MVNSNERLLPVRCLIDEPLLQRIEAWGRTLAKRPAVSIHFGNTLPLGYSARTALLIGIEELKVEEHILDAYELEGTPSALGVAMPLWFKEVLDREAKRLGISRVQIIREALDRGLPL